MTVTATRQSDSAAFLANTWNSGGYSLQVGAGTYTLSFTGGSLGGTVTVGGVIVTDKNVKIDATAADAVVVHVGPEIEIVDNSETSWDRRLQFANTRSGQTTAPLQLSLTNGGDQTLAVSQLRFNNDTTNFTIAVKDHTGSAVPDNSFNIPSGRSFLIEVIFMPQGAGQKQGQITFNTNDPDDGEGSLTLLVNGTADLAGNNRAAARHVGKFKPSDHGTPRLARDFTGQADRADYYKFKLRKIGDPSGNFRFGATEVLATTLATPASAGVWRTPFEISEAGQEGDLMVELEETG